MEKKEQKLKEYEDTINRLLRNMSHQITRPILELKQAAYIFSSHGFSPEAYKYFKVALAEIERGIRNFNVYTMLTTDFQKTVSRDIIQSNFDLSEILKNAIDRIRPYLEVDQRKININAKGTLLPKISGNASAFTECLVNVFHNAIKYSLGGRPIEVEIDYIKSRKQVEMRVSNYGIELNKEYWEEIFKPANRTETTKILSIEGSGLRLFISRKSLELNNSIIKVESCIPCEPTQDGNKRFRTTFLISIPRGT